MRDCLNCMRKLNCISFEIAEDTHIMAMTCRSYIYNGDDIISERGLGSPCDTSKENKPL